MPACPWACPVCRAPLVAVAGERRLACPESHSYDVARQGYVNLLLAGQRRSRQPGDSAEMVEARRRFLGSGAYDRIGDTLGHVVSRAALAVHERHPGDVIAVLDVGCGDGHHTRRVAGNVTGGAPGIDPLDALVAAIDVSKPAIAQAARAHPSGWYAVASAAQLPLAPGSVDVAFNVFGPVVVEELARVVRRGGAVVVAHPGRSHLQELRALVYAEPRPHEIKDPLRHGLEWFSRTGTVTVTFPIIIDDGDHLWDLFTMTPYRWHAPPDVRRRLDAEAARPGGFVTEVDVVISSYARRATLESGCDARAH